MSVTWHDLTSPGLTCHPSLGHTSVNPSTNPHFCLYWSPHIIYSLCLWYFGEKELSLKALPKYSSTWGSSTSTPSFIIHYEPLWFHWWTKASPPTFSFQAPNLLNSSLSAVRLFRTTPALLISSLHLVLCLISLLFPCLGCHSVILIIHL